MKKIIIYGIVLLILVTSVFAIECGSVPTDSCSVSEDTTFEPGTYYLPSGITITGDDITFDCNGAILSTEKIDLGFWDGITIKNCILNVGNSGGTVISIRGNDNKLISNTINGGPTRDTTILILGSNNQLIDNVLVDSPDVAVMIHISKNVELIGNTIKDNNIGVMINWEHPGNPIIKNNNFINNKNVHPNDGIPNGDIVNIYDDRRSSSVILNVENNYWRTIDKTEIDSGIIRSHSGIVDFDPFLCGPWPTVDAVCTSTLFDEAIVLYHFDKDSNFNEAETFVYDFSGNNYNLTPVPGNTNIPQVVLGKLGNAYYWQKGIKGSLRNTDALDDEKTVTIAFWLNIMNDGTDIIFSKGLWNKEGYYLQFSDWNDNLAMVFNRNGASEQAVCTGCFIGKYGQWIHLTMVITPSSISWYSNGEFFETDILVNAWVAPTNTLIVGTNAVSANFDELIAWNRALTSNEILELYNSYQNILRCVDNDNDGYYAISPTCATGNDCNDNNTNVNPGAVEVCDDNMDNDCNGNIDRLDSDCVIEPSNEWLVSGNDVYYNNGNVGIGTSRPIDTLHVVGGITIDDPNAQIEFYGEDGRKWVVGLSGGASDNFNIYDRSSERVRFSINEGSGKVNINDLTGSGNAYVCVNSTGDLFRSLVPCK